MSYLQYQSTIQQLFELHDDDDDDVVVIVVVVAVIIVVVLVTASYISTLLIHFLSE